MKHLGSVKTSVYIYMVPVITAVTSAVILHERLTGAAACGIVLTLAGLFLSEKRVQNKEVSIHETGLTLGKHIPETIGPEVLDKSGCAHLGIIQIPVPVLKADKEKIKEIRQRLYQPDFASRIVVDFQY